MEVQTLVPKDLDAVFLNPPFLPKFSRYSRSPCVTTGGTLYYPLMECIAAAYVEKHGFKTRVIDSVARNLTDTDTVTEIKALSPTLITVATSTPSIDNDVRIAEMLKAAMPQAFVVLVGRHASWAPEHTLSSCHAVDGVIRNDYYQAALAILQGKPLRQIQGITFRNGTEIIHNADEASPIDPNEIPMISPIVKRDLDTGDYFYASLTNPYMMLQHSWGCSFNCAFCNEMYKASVRSRTPDLTIQELKFIETQMPHVKEILFDDPTFVTNEEDTRKLCEAMIAAKVKLTWSCNLRCDVDYEILKLMKKAGCRLAHTGNESLTQEGKNSVKKGMKLERELQFLADAKRAGILIHGCFIVGLPSDNANTLRQTIERAKKLPFDTVQVFPLIPTPNTSTWKWAEEGGYLVTRDYADWLKEDGSYNCVMTTPNLSREDVDEWIKTFIREFYLRPSYISRKMAQSLRSWPEMRRNVTAGTNLLRKLRGGAR